jgi:hypothetical protein
MKLAIELISGHSIFLCIHKEREIGVVVLYSRHVLKESDSRHIL